MTIKSIIGIRTIKTGIGAALAMICADMLGLKFATAAGIVTILSIQSTKKQSIEMAVKRLWATGIALAIATILFNILGYTPIVFGIYLLIFIPIAAKVSVVEGIVPASVLVTHLLTEGQVTGELLVNEVLLIIVGAGVALILNLYMPSIEKELYRLRSSVEKDLHKLFVEMAGALRAHSVAIDEEVLFSRIERTLQEGSIKAYKQTNNHLFAQVSVYERYFQMRLKQFQVVCYMREHFSRFFMQYQETEDVATFTMHVADLVHGRRTSNELLQELEELRNHFKTSSLPTTREEFENRAMLYQFLNDLEHFLEIKKQFRESLTEKELLEYENGYE